MNENDVLKSLGSPDVKNKLERYYNSSEYREVSRQLNDNNAKFAELPKPLQLSVLYMNSMGLDTDVGEFWRFLYRVKPPTIEEYLTEEHGGAIVNNIYPGWKKVILRDFQRGFERALPSELIYSGCVGCHGAGEGIMMYDGSIKLSQDVCVGDLLMGPDSTPRTVLELKRGREDLFKVTTRKGESFIVNNSHILRLRSAKYSKRGWLFEETNTSVKDLNLLSKYHISSRRQLIKSPVSFNPQKHILPPYLIGILLGDGSLHGGIAFHSADLETAEAFKQEAFNFGLKVTEYPDTGHTKYKMSSFTGKVGANPVLTELHRLGMMGKNWNNKSVPSEYKFDSPDNLLEILAGLIDTDGTYQDARHCYEFYSKSYELAKDVEFIARSLGFNAKVKEKIINSQYVTDSLHYRVAIYGELNKIPCRIKRKKARLRISKKNVAYHNIAEIEPLGDDVFYGWVVDKDHLYLDDDFFIHHNSGKTTIARFLHGYNLIRMCSLINPQATLNVTQETLLVLALFTVTLDKASLALIKPFISLLGQSPYFQEVTKLNEFGDFRGSGTTPYLVRAKYIEFPNNIVINLGSKVEHAISYSMFGAMLDEAEFRGSLEDTFAIYTNLKERIRSRFLGSPYTLLTLISSARYSQGIIADYIKNTKPDDPNTKVYSFAIWDIKHFEAYDKGHFYVLRGTAAHPHRILTESEYASYEANTFSVPTKCEIVRVPSVYRRDFESRISDALQNLAGMAVLHNSSYVFPDVEGMEYDQLVPEVDVVSDLGVNDNLYNLLPESLFEDTLNVRRFRVAPDAPRYLHGDLATTTEAGICISHPELDGDRVMYVVDCTIRITTNTQIDLNAIERMILTLSDVCHFASITFDQFQSTMIRQSLSLNGAADKVELFSVISTVDPYQTVSRLAQNKQIAAGRSPTLMKQLNNVQYDPGRTKDKIYSDKNIARTDMSDALVGSLYNCVMDFNKTVRYDVKEWRDVRNAEAEKTVLLDGYQSM